METVTTEANGQTADWATAAAASEVEQTDQKQASKPPRFFTMELGCQLSVEELAAIGKEAAKAREDIAEIEEEKKTETDRLKSKLSKAEEHRDELLDKIGSGKEMREVECREDFLFETNTVRITRLDTGEMVSERAMTRGERQGELPLEVGRAADSEPAPSTDDDITDPQAVLDGETSEDAPAEKPARKRGRKS